MIKKKGIIRRTLGSMFNVQRWFSLPTIIISTKIFWKFARDIFVRQPSMAATSETFEEAVKRFSLTEEDIKQRGKAFLRNSLMFLFISMILFFYTIYLLVNAYLLATFISALLTILVLVYAYREHFWYTQIKHRKLGLNFKIWWQLLLKKEITL